MTRHSNVGHLRSVHLGVTDLAVSLDFYTRVWGLHPVGSADGMHLLRGQGTEHHIVALSQSSSAGLRRIEFAAESVDELHELVRKAGEMGVEVRRGVHHRPDAFGGGACTELQGPGGLVVAVSCGVAGHAQPLGDPTMPLKVTHVVLNSERFALHEKVFVSLLGLRLSDRTRRMDFLRSATDHHSVALAQGDNDRLNHIAFEMGSIDGQLYGAGRVVEAGYPLEWGPGRHGPGNNVFCYFVDPDGLAIEYTTEIEQIDSIDRVAGTAEEWDRFPRRPCRWGLAKKPSERLSQAFASRR